MICFNLDDKIKTNQTQYDLSTEAAKISALPLKSVDKYAHLTFEDLGYKPGVAEQAKFEYSPLGNFFNKRLEKEEKKRTFDKVKKHWRQKLKTLKIDWR